VLFNWDFPVEHEINNNNNNNNNNYFSFLIILTNNLNIIFTVICVNFWAWVINVAVVITVLIQNINCLFGLFPTARIVNKTFQCFLATFAQEFERVGVVHARDASVADEFRESVPRAHLQIRCWYVLRVCKYTHLQRCDLFQKFVKRRSENILHVAAFPQTSPANVGEVGRVYVVLHVLTSTNVKWWVGPGKMY
jgi:hypothetical protein